MNSSPEVVFCGYTVPHPAERKLHVRIQTNGPKAIDILKRGLKDLENLCDETTVIFKVSVFLNIILKYLSSDWYLSITISEEYEP